MSSDISDDDILDVCAEDADSAPVESVIKTRVKDAGDVDLEKVIPYQNYFYNESISTDPSETKITEVITEIQVQTKRKRRDLNKEIAKHNAEVKPRKQKLYPLDRKTKNPVRISVLHHFKSSNQTNTKNQA